MIQTEIKNPKHIRSFWPIVAILVVAAIVAGIIIYAANSNILQDETNSLSYSVYKR